MSGGAGTIRYACEHGPVLLACTGELPARIARDPPQAAQKLEPVPGQPLQFEVDERLLVSYSQLADDTLFTGFPVLNPRGPK
jgi:hypothetical protein